MSELIQNLIDKNFVHKKDEKNIFLANLRRKFPNFFEQKFFESVLNKLSDVEREFILIYYSPISSDNVLFLDKQYPVYYKINSIINTLESEKIDFIKNNLDEKNKNFIFSHYQLDQSDNSYKLIHDISEEEEKQILSILNENKYHITDVIKKEIADIFEKIEEIPKGDIVYANMHINLDHDFFFEHSLDHVPGMMILETYRQFFVAVSLVYGKVPVYDAQLVLEYMDSKYYKYMELAFPIILKGHIRECKSNNEGYWSYLDFEADAFQNFDIVAHFRSYGQSMNNKLFHRVRRIEKEKIMKNHRYKPGGNFITHINMKSMKDNKYLPITLENISYGGFMLKSNIFSQDISPDNSFNFFIHFSNTGFIHGECEKVWQDMKKNTAGFKIKNISDEDLLNLKNSIVRYCQVYNRREIY